MAPDEFASATAQQWPMGSVSKERLFSATVEAAEQRAREARKAADVAACEVLERHALQAVLEARGYPHKRGHLVRLRRSTLTTKDDGGPWYPGDQRDRN